MEVPKFSFINGGAVGVRVFGSAPTPTHSPREVGSMVAREFIEFARLALRRHVDVEQLVDWQPLMPEYPAPPRLPPWMPPPPKVDGRWLREYFHGVVNTLDRADGSVAESPQVVAAFERASRALRAHLAQLAGPTSMEPHAA